MSSQQKGFFYYGCVHGDIFFKDAFDKRSIDQILSAFQKFQTEQNTLCRDRSVYKKTTKMRSCCASDTTRPRFEAFEVVW